MQHADNLLHTPGETPTLAGGVPTAAGRVPLAPGSRVLIVEDDFMLAEDLRDKLERQGHRVIGPAATLAAARQLLHAEPALSLAILDTHLEDETTQGLAEALKAGGVPVIFATDLEPWALAPDVLDSPILAKPVTLHQLERWAAP